MGLSLYILYTNFTEIYCSIVDFITTRPRKKRLYSWLEAAAVDSSRNRQGSIADFTSSRAQ